MPKVDEVFLVHQRRMFSEDYTLKETYEIEKIIICIEGEIIDFLLI